MLTECIWTRWKREYLLEIIKAICYWAVEVIGQGKKEETFSPSRSIMKPQLLMNGIKATINLLTSTSKRCPHLGCTLKWNPAEHTWDCPCHGSRFHEDGKIIDNPSTGDEKKQFYGCKLPKYYL